MKKQLTHFITVLLLVLWQQHSFAQCNINNATATPVNGVCVQDGVVNVAIPGATACGTTTSATIRESGSSTDLTFITLSNTGTGQFTALEPGSYDVYVTQGATTVGPLAVTVTSSYTPMTVTATPTNCSCSSGDTLYSDNGILNAAVTGGTGPFLYEVMQGLTVVQTFGPSTDVSHQFTGLAPGNYSLRLTDLSAACSSQEARTFAIQQTVYKPKLAMYMLRAQRMSTAGVCGMSRLSFELQYGNLNALNIPGNVTATYGGNTYNLTAPTTGTFRQFVLTNVPDNTTVVFNATDGCNTVTTTFTTKPVDPTFIDMVGMDLAINNCVPSVRFAYNGLKPGAGFQWKSNVVLAMYKEVPADSNNWVFVQNATNTAILWSGGSTTYMYSDDITTRYKFIATDDCHSAEEIMDPRRLTGATNPLSLTTLHEENSILEGTSAIRFRKNGGNWNPTGDNISYPVDIEVVRTDGTSNITILPSNPYTLSGSYTINFPINTQWLNLEALGGNGFGYTLGDLPMGEYQVTLTDACGISYTRVINLTQQASYSPTITMVAGCAASDIQYNMGATHAANYSKVKLYTDNGSGGPGTLVRNETENGTFQLNGQFSTVPPGDYVIGFTAINYFSTVTPFVLPLTTNQFSAATNTGFSNLNYYVPVTVEPYVQASFSTATVYCDAADPNSGIVGISVEGNPVGYIQYQIWPSTADPNTDPALATYNTVDLTETSHNFTGLSNGDYIIRVSTSCGFTQQTINLNNDPLIAPHPVITPNGFCLSNNDVVLRTVLPSSLYDITWTDSLGNTVGTGSSVTVNPTATETYTMAYTLSAALGCSSTSSGSVSGTANLLSDVSLVGTPTTVCSTVGSGGYTVSIEVTGTAPFNVVGTGTPGSWSGNVWTSEIIDYGVAYNVNIDDSNSCNTLNVAALAPNCCVYEVSCPTFPATTVQCYTDLPSQTSYTEIEFESLGNANGLIGNNPCGVIEITASNSANAGTCPQTITRTYIVTEYVDSNNNDIRDTGENTVLNTTTCTQNITVEDTIAPAFVQALPANTTVECSAVPTAAVLTATDNCTAPQTVTYAETRTDGSCTNNYTLARVWTATDACGNTTSHTQTITVQDTTAPVVTGTIAAANAEGCAASAAPAAVTTVAALEGMGLTIADACTSDATLVVTSSDTSAGTCPIVVTRTYTITDACGNFTTATQTINIQDTTAPVVTGTITAANAEGCAASAAPAAVTTVAALEGMGLTIADTCTPDTNLLVTSTDTSAGTCPIVVTRTYTITDTCGNFTTATQTINIQDTTAPVVTGTITAANVQGCSVAVAPAAVTTVAALEGMGLTIADACTPDATLVVTSTDTSAGTCPIVVTRTYRITDACGNFTTATQTINIQDTTAPVVTGTITTANAEGCAASAAPAAVTTVAALEGMGLTIADTCTSDATLVVTSADTSAGTCPIVVTRTYTITDACGNFTTATQTINVQDTTAPVVTGTITAANAEGCTASAAPAAVTTVAALEGMGLTIADACTPDATLVVTSADTSAGTCPIVVTRTYTITDACGNFTTATQTINVQDTTAPVVTGTIAPANAEGCAASAAPAAVTTVAALEGMGLTIADACTSDATLVVTSADTSAGTCPIVVTRTYTITDACGNFTTATQIIDIQDTTVPVFLGNLPSDLVLECSDVIPTVETLIAADNCAGIPTVTFVEVNTQGSCPNAFTLTRTWTATDVCGNQTIHTQTIDVEDTTAPVFVGNLPETVIFANCDAIPEAATLTATDNCGSATVVYGDPVEVEGDCTNRKSIIRTWTATDECGNTSTFTQTVYLACYVTVYNAVSPNGDGINDEFIIEGLECYPNNTVEVYNRWGVKVYETSGYDNINKAFKGYSDGRSTISPDQLLPTGTYFYILKYEYDLYGKNQQNIEKSGYLYLQSN